ncbi:hypothetical protein FQZ97_1276490 [compost metagenome]
MRGTRFIALVRSLVHRLAARPYSLSLAMAMACSSSSKGITESTGPNTSARATDIAWVTSASTVGLT